MEELFALILAIATLIFAIPYALAILLYTFPLFILWQMLPTRIGEEPQVINDVLPHAQLAKLRAERKTARDRYDELRYSDWGIRWSDNLDRFEERSVRGRELNEQLGFWTAERQRITSEIQEAERPEADAFAQWSNELCAWYEKQDRSAAKQSSWKLALLVFIGVSMLLELVGLAFPALSKFFTFAWNPAPDYLHPGLGLGALVGWATALYKIRNPPTSFARPAQMKITEYWDAKMARAQAADLEFAASNEATSESEDFSEDNYEEDQNDANEAWYEVLSVSAEATAAEIKKAYREKIQQYHPDRVSGLGEKLQLLAKLETQKLNAAREAGMSLRK